MKKDACYLLPDGWGDQYAQYEAIERRAQKTSPICVLTGFLPNYYPLAAWTVYRNKADYCLRHGYHLEVYKGIMPEFSDPLSHAGGHTWSRMKHMLGLVESGRFEWVWCVGCDTIITNLTIKLESIIGTACTPEAEATPLPVCPYFPNSPAPPTVIQWQEPPNHPKTGKKHVLFCGERVTAVQADSFIIRGSKEGAAYLKDILSQWPHYKHHAWVENQAMIDLRDKWAAITHIVPQWMLNSVDYSRWYSLHKAYRDGKDCYGNRGQWQKGDFLLHMPAATIEQRLDWCRQYWPKIVQ